MAPRNSRPFGFRGGGRTPGGRGGGRGRGGGGRGRGGGGAARRAQRGEGVQGGVSKKERTPQPAPAQKRPRRVHVVDAGTLQQAVAAHLARHGGEAALSDREHQLAGAQLVRGGEEATAQALGAALRDQCAAGEMPTLVLSGAALRCVELYKAMRKVAPMARPLKLFAKHLKVAEQTAWLAQGGMRAAGVGTPGRVRQLAAAGALSLDSVQVIVLDVRRDTKQFDLLSHPDTAADAMHLLVGSEKARVMLLVDADADADGEGGEGAFSAAAQQGKFDPDDDDEGAEVDAELLED